MKLQTWLKRNGKTQAWLAQQLDRAHGRGSCTPAAVSNRLKEQREYGRTLPKSWIPVVLTITNGEVGLSDEWPTHISGGYAAPDREAS